MAKLQRISKGGQVSVPALVRRRWGTQSVLIEDHGDSLIVRPVPDDPIDAAHGAFASSREPTAAELRRDERDAEIDRERRA